MSLLNLRQHSFVYTHVILGGSCDETGVVERGWTCRCGTTRFVFSTAHTHVYVRILNYVAEELHFYVAELPLQLQVAAVRFSA